MTPASITIMLLSVPEKAEDLAGRQFHELTVIGLLSRKPTRWLCRCICGNLTAALASNLQAGSVRSCGCLPSRRVSARSRTHGWTLTPEHRAWATLRNRCRSKTNKDYRNYGGRGIAVDPSWDKFENFLADMGPRPSPAHTVDRIDPNGDYSATNCRWATILVQNNNKRNTVVLDFRGQRLSLAQLARSTGIAAATIQGRVKRGWSVERAATEPPKRVENFASANARRKRVAALHRRLREERHD